MPVTFEFTCMKINNQSFCKSRYSENLLFISLYRFHLGSLIPFFDEFNAFLNYLATQTLDVIVAGDFNIKLNNRNDNDTIKLYDLLAEFGFTIFVVEEKTHVSGNTLDFGFCSPNLIELVENITVDHKETISDHFPVVFEFISSELPHT